MLTLNCESSGVRINITVRITAVQMQRYWKHSFHSQEVCQCPGFDPRDIFPSPNNATNLRLCTHFHENRSCLTVCIKSHLYTNQVNSDNKLVYSFLKIRFSASLKSTHCLHWSSLPVVPYVCLSLMRATRRVYIILLNLNPMISYLLKIPSMKPFIQLS